MNDKRKVSKSPATPEKIYQIMMIITFAVATLFIIDCTLIRFPPWICCVVYVPFLYISIDIDILL